MKLNHSRAIRMSEFRAGKCKIQYSFKCLEVKSSNYSQQNTLYFSLTNVNYNPLCKQA